MTQPLRFANSFEEPGEPCGTALFERLADALQLSESALELLVCELLVYVDATPATLGAEQLWNMRTGLFELVDNVLPADAREGTRSRLILLMLDVAPLDREGRD